MMSEKALILPCLLLLLHTRTLLCHPQCLDFRPPFESNAQAAFCSNYTDFGCCTQEEDAALEHFYLNSIVEELLANADTNDNCSSYIRDILCQPCSPYAAHIFDGEATGQNRIFPGLCEDYCKQLFGECRDLLDITLRQIQGSDALLESLKSESDFCGKVRLADAHYCFPNLLTNPVLNGNIQPSIVNSEGCLCVELFANDLRNPIFLRYPEDGTDRVFVGEQYGVISVYVGDKRRRNVPIRFLDLSEKVYISKRRGDERGLLNLAFHPNYRNNKRFFVLYYTRDGGRKVRVSEFTVNRFIPNIADPQSEKVILEIPKRFGNHNGGEMLFGDDGYLYLFTGDGGSSGDPDNNGQNLSVLHAKVLRIDVDSSQQPYGIPPNNPFLNDPKARPEIYAYGVRNIWRCGKDRGDPVTGYGKGRIVCGDLGQSRYEEINLLKPGVNYGWSGYEANDCFNNDLCGNIGPVEKPIFSYGHGTGRAVIGGHFYRGCENPNLNGAYIYGDYSTGRLFRLMEKDDKWSNKEIDMCGPEYCKTGLHSQYSPAILSFGEDYSGEIYMLTTSSRGSSVTEDGSIYKLVDPRRRNNPLNCEQMQSRRFPGQNQQGTPNDRKSFSRQMEARHSRLPKGYPWITSPLEDL